MVGGYRFVPLLMRMMLNWILIEVKTPLASALLASAFSRAYMREELAEPVRNPGSWALVGFALGAATRYCG